MHTQPGMRHAGPGILSATDLWKAYRSSPPVLCGVTLDVSPGHVLAIVGRNGAGKTTLLKVLSGLISLDRGSVSVGGFPPASRSARASVGVSLHPSALYPQITAREALRLFGSYHVRPILPDVLLAQVGLMDVAGCRFSAMSSGQRQRLFLALALVGRPRVLLLDEPTSHLDAAGRGELWSVLRRFIDEGGCIALATHSREEVDAIATHVAILDRGRMVDAGAVGILQPQSTEMAEMIATASVVTERLGRGREIDPAA